MKKREELQEALASLKSQEQSISYMQTRDLTDEEWLRLPKEEILQLYKNCYSMLKSQLKPGYPKEFVEWWFKSGFMMFAIEGFSDPVLFIKFDEGSKKKYTLDELYNHWQTEVSNG